ncbi:MAG: cysteine desulfurase [Parcubacteria group bacterium Gr01-1014_56]|nr:MAG: cysteine desulfurase [Parcubacteria group bacterium Gr01-1014_56]
MKLWFKRKSRRVYADAAAATPLSNSVQQELLRLLPLYGNPSGLHSEAQEAKKELEGARKKIADVLGAHSDEIIFTGSGTEANNLGIHGVLQPLLNKHGEVHAITSAIEHSSVLVPLYAMERDGLYITELSVNESGLVSPHSLREIINDETAFVSIQMINSEIGSVQAIREIAKEVRHAKRERISKSEGSSLPLYLHVDASQAPLWLPLKVDALGVDFLTLDAQKIMGPKGVGLLYARRGVSFDPIIFGGGQEAGKRSGTENVALAGAFRVALTEAQAGVEERVRRISHVRNYALEEIQKRIPDVMLNGAVGEERVANNINISIPGLNGDMAVVALNAEGIAVSTRSACDTDDEAPSHVLQAIGTKPERAKNSIRITLLPDATIDEAGQIAKTLSEVAARYNQK